MMYAKRLVSLVALSVVLGSTVACGGNGNVITRDPATYILRGTVRSGGSGLAGVQVVLSGDAAKTTRTDTQGGFSFAGVSGNAFFVTPTLDGYAFTPLNYQLGAGSRADLDFAAAAAPPPKRTGYEVGDTPPEFTAVDQNGQKVSLYSSSGKVVFIDICADWCGSCRYEAPMLQAAYEEFKDQGLQVITILVEGSTADWASTYKLTYPVIPDNGRTISGGYATGWLPTNVVIDRSMTIRYRDFQDLEQDQLFALIRKYL